MLRSVCVSGCARLCWCLVLRFCVSICVYVCVSVCWGRSEICRCFSQGVCRVFVYVCLEGLGSQCNPPNCCMQTFLLPRPPSPAAQLGVGREGGLGEAVEGGVGKEQGGGVLLLGAKQQHWAERARDGNIPGGGRSWEKKPRQERRRRGEVVGEGWAKGRMKIFGEEDAEKAQSFPGPRLILQIWGGVACLAPLASV